MRLWPVKQRARQRMPLPSAKVPVAKMRNLFTSEIETMVLLASQKTSESICNSSFKTKVLAPFSTQAGLLTKTVTYHIISLSYTSIKELSLDCHTCIPAFCNTTFSALLPRVWESLPLNREKWTTHSWLSISGVLLYCREYDTFGVPKWTVDPHDIFFISRGDGSQKVCRLGKGEYGPVSSPRLTCQVLG